MRSDPNGDEGVACLSARFPRGQPENTWALTSVTAWFHKTPFIRAKGCCGADTVYHTVQHDGEDRVPVEILLPEAWEAKWI